MGGDPMTDSRKRRGRATELIVAEYLREHGFPHAEAVGSGAAGVDIKGVVGWAIEVKARKGFDPLAWMRQAKTRPGTPAVIVRCNGQGEASVGDWIVMVRLDDWVGLVGE
jgi:Holliday junction resolvase